MLFPDINLKAKGLVVEKALTENIIPFEQVGLTCEDYQHLIANSLMPRPGQLSGKLSIPEGIWFEIVRELQASNYLQEHIVLFRKVLMTQVDFLSEDAVPLEPDVIYNYPEKEYEQRIELSCRVLDLFVAYLLKDKKDVQLQFNRQGKFKIIYFDDMDADKNDLEGPVINFRLSQLLEKLIGKNNIPAIAQLYTQVTLAEAEVLKALRMPEFVTVSVEKASPGSSYTWDVIGREIGNAGVGEAKRICEEVPKGYNKFVLNGQESKEMPFELFRRKRCW